MIDHDIFYRLSGIGSVAGGTRQSEQVGSPFHKGPLIIDIIAIGTTAVGVYLLIDAAVGVAQSSTHPSINFFGALQILLIARGIVEVAGHANGGVVGEAGLLLLVRAPPDAAAKLVVPTSVVHIIPCPLGLFEEALLVSDEIASDVGQSGPQEVVVELVPGPVGELSLLSITALGRAVA